MLRSILLLSLLTAGCGDSGPAYMFDAGADFSIAPQATHIGPAATVCCLQTRSAQFAMYLTNPAQGAIDGNGREHPGHGSLHIASPYGVDFVLADRVPANGYTFTPEGLWAMYMAPSKSAALRTSFSLNFAPIEAPDFSMGTPIQAISDGLDDAPLSQIGFFSPSGHYFIVGVLPKNVAQSADLHVVDVHQGKDVFQLGSGAFSYFELMAPDDTMIYENSTASTVAGQPSVQGLYVINLSAAAAGAQPSLIDQHVIQASLLADGHSLIYERANRDLMYYDLRDKNFTMMARNVAAFSVGPGRRGPVAYIGNDRSVHVVPKLQPEITVLPPASVDILSPILFSPDGAHLYYFSKVDSQNGHGVMLHQAVRSTAPSQLVGQRVSTTSTTFFQNRMIFLDNVNANGDSGDLFVANLDGTGAQLMSTGVVTGDVQQAFPVNFGPPVRNPGFGPVDLSPIVVPPVFANLSGAQRDFSKANSMRPIAGGRPIVGALVYGPKLGGAEATIDPAVRTGGYGFSDDGFVLAYAGGAAWSSNALNYVGKLTLFPTLVDVGIVPPNVDKVSEIGPIVSRSFFTLAPDNSNPGLYFVNY